MPDGSNGNDAGTALAVFREARLPYHPAIEERFGIDKAGWKALTDAIFPLATSTDSVVLALSYCRARKLDPFKRCVHIVPVWSSEQQKMVDTVWPGIGELRTTAFRTSLYAGRDEAEFGPDVTRKLDDVEITFPEWCRITVYRICNGQAVAFAGPRVYWLETYATAKRNTVAPNAMWRRRVRGQIEKCAEAAALRAAFPEEIGDDQTADEVEGLPSDGSREPAPPRPRRADFAKGRATAIDADIVQEATTEATEPAAALTVTLATPEGEALDYDLPASTAELRRDFAAEAEKASKMGPAAVAGFAESNAALLAAVAGIEDLATFLPATLEAVRERAEKAATIASGPKQGKAAPTAGDLV